MDATKKNKIKAFLNDRVMCEAVYESLLNRFLKPEKNDVQTAAARFMAIGELQDAWKDMERVREELKEDSGQISNVGL